MSSPILVTKFFIPTTRPELVNRTRLLDELNGGLHRKLTLISAPAGFGKTTLVSHWLENLPDEEKIGGHPIKVAWLSLDEDDNDPVRFLTYAITALNQIKEIEADIGQGVLSLLQSSQPPPTEIVLTSLINEIAVIREKIIFVLDDYHLIESEPVHQALVFLLENLPPQIHLVIATRQDPSLPLGRLRAQNQITELRAADLRFSSTEAAEFLNQVMGLDLSAQDIADMETRTEGWIAGLQLAAISMQGRTDHQTFIKSFTGGHRLVLDFLIEEVMEQQPEDIQDFLMQTAILDRLTGPLCDALTGQDNGQKILEMLDRANLFIVHLDEERRWYRYHHLFAELLRQKLRQKHVEEIDNLHRKASFWFEQEDDIDNSIEHALLANDFERAADIIQETIDSFWRRGEHRNLERWLNLLPEEELFARPDICIYFARYKCNIGRFDDAQNILNITEKAVNNDHREAVENKGQKQDSKKIAEKNKLLGRISATRGVLASFQGDVKGMLQFSSEALDLLPMSDLTWRNLTGVILGNAHGFNGNMAAAYDARYKAMQACEAAGDQYLTIMSHLEIAITLRAQGRLKDTIEVCQLQMLVAREKKLQKTRIVGWLLAVWGETLAEVNDLDEGIQRAREGFLIAEESGDLPIIGWSLFCLIRVLFSRGDLKEAEEIIKRIERESLNLQYPAWILSQLAAWQARIDLAHNKIEEASNWVNNHALDPDMGMKPTHEIHFFLLSEYVVAARTLIGQCRWDDAGKLLEHLLVTAEDGCRTSKTIEILILLSLTYQALEKTDQAQVELKKALTIAKPEGFIRTFVDEGPPMAKLLYEALQRDIYPEYVQRLLAAFPVNEPEEVSQKGQADQPGLIEPLSEREIEVLELLAKGHTNQEVAQKLYLSPHTIKTHTRNIYSKLGVNNRTQAVDKARTLGIISSI